MFVPAPNTAMVELIFNSNGQVCENTLYFERSTAMQTADMNTLAAALRDWWNVNMKALTPTQTSLTEIRVTDLTTQNATGISFVTGLPIAGTSNAGTVPNNVTVAVRFSTNLRGRSRRGRNYIVGLPLNYINGQQLLAAAIPIYVAAYSLLMGAGAFVANWTWVVLSRYTNNAPRPTAIGTAVTGIKIEPTLDSQRRRLPGRGA